MNVVDLEGNIVIYFFLCIEGSLENCADPSDQ